MQFGFSIKNRIAQHARAHLSLVVLVIVFVVILAFGIKDCLPMTCVADENVFTGQARHMLDNNFRPGSYAHPGLFQGTLLTIGLHVLGISSDRGVAIYLLGRAFTLAISALSLVLVYAIVFEIFHDKRKAFLAGMLYAVNPLIAHFSIIFRTDIFMTFFYLASVYVVLLYVRFGRLRLLLLSGILAGFSVASKYPGLLVTVPIFLTLGSVAISEKNFKHMVYGVGIFLIGLVSGILVSSPYIVVEFEKVIGAIQLEARSTHPGADGLSMWGNMRWYISRLFNIYGNGLFVLACVSIPLTVRRVWQKYGTNEAYQLMTVVIALVSFFVFMSALKLHWTRWIITLIPLLAVLTAPVLDRSLQVVQGKHTAILVLVLVLLVFPPLFRTAVFINSKVIGDTRAMQAQWWEEHGEESQVVYDGYTGFLPRDSLGFKVRHVEEYAGTYDVLVTSAYTYRRYFEEPERYSQQVALYSEIFALEEVQTFEPSLNSEDFHADETNFSDLFLMQTLLSNPRAFIGPYGPHITIYRL